MQSWSLARFVSIYGPRRAGEVCGMSRQAVESALNIGREINIVAIDGFYEVHETKQLSKQSIMDIGALVPLGISTQAIGE